MSDVQAALREFAERKRQQWLEPTRGVCPGCGADDVILSTRARGDVDDEPQCAECNRKAAFADTTTSEYPCDRCNATPAFRDPAHRQDVMLCADCHAADGFVPGERSMLTTRTGYTRSDAAPRAQCSIDAQDHGGQVKPRGRHGMVCDKHWNPKKYLELRDLETR